MEVFKLLGTIAIDIQDATENIEEVTDTAEESEGKMSTAFKRLGGIVAGVFAADKLKDFGVACIESAANATATASQFTQVFGDLEDQARQNLSGIADETGVLESRMIGSYTKIAAFAQVSGMNTADALDLTNRAMVAVADSAAFYDRSLEETTESLQSFLKGNYANDAALGLSCTEVTRNAAANELYGKSFNDLSEAQKQLTLLKMVEDANALSGAMGQAARESDTWTNQTGNLQQAWTDFTAMIGGAFLPVAVRVVTKLQEFVTWATENNEIIIILAGAVAAFTGTLAAYNAVQAIKAAMNAAETTSLWALVAAQTAAVAPYIAVAAAITAAIAVGVLIVKNWDAIKEKAVELWHKLTEVFGKIKESVSGAWDGMWKSIKGVLNSMIGGVEGWVNGTIKAINRLISGLNSLVSAAGNLLGLDWKIPSMKSISLPRLEKGGILKKGQVGLLEGNGAEAVVPLDQNREWITKVANDMEYAMGGKETAGLLTQILEAITDSKDELKESFTRMTVEVNGRELGRIVDKELGRFGYQKARGR